jgi:hypothetical protein
MRFFDWDGDPAVMTAAGDVLVGGGKGEVGRGSTRALLEDMRAPELSREEFDQRFGAWLAGTPFAAEIAAAR